MVPSSKDCLKSGMKKVKRNAIRYKVSRSGRGTYFWSNVSSIKNAYIPFRLISLGFHLPVTSMSCCFPWWREISVGQQSGWIKQQSPAARKHHYQQQLSKHSTAATNHDRKQMYILVPAIFSFIPCTESSQCQHINLINLHQSYFTSELKCKGTLGQDKHEEVKIWDWRERVLYIRLTWILCIRSTWRGTYNVSD